MPWSPLIFTLFPYTTLFRSIIFNNRSNVTLRGAGPTQTFVVFSAGDTCNGLGADVCVINGDNNYSGDPHNVATWTGGYAKGDRKSTRLNSSHRCISYAVFCLNAMVTTNLYTLSLHDALPIYHFQQ